MTTRSNNVLTPDIMEEISERFTPKKPEPELPEKKVNDIVIKADKRRGRKPVEEIVEEEITDAEYIDMLSRRQHLTTAQKNNIKTLLRNKQLKKRNLSLSK